MPTGTSSTTQSTNPTLTNIFTQLFGTAGTTGVNALSSIASGQNIAQLNQQLTTNNQQTFAGQVGQIKEAFGSSGMGSSSALGKVLTTAATQNTNNLTTTLAGADLTAQGQQLSAANYLSQIFSQSANQYFQNGSTSFNPLQLISTIFGSGGVI